MVINLKVLANDPIGPILSKLPIQSHHITLTTHKEKTSKMVYEEKFLDGSYF